MSLKLSDFMLFMLSERAGAILTQVLHFNEFSQSEGKAGDPCLKGKEREVLAHSSQEGSKGAAPQVSRSLLLPSPSQMLTLAVLSVPRGA